MHTLMPCSGARDRLSDGSEGRDRQIHEMILLNAHGKLPPQQAGRADAAPAEMSVQLHLAHYRKGTPEVPARPEQGCPSAERSTNQSGGALISLQTFKEFMTHVPIRKAVDALIRTSLFPVHAGITFPETDLHPVPGRRFRTIRPRQTALPELQAKGRTKLLQRAQARRFHAGGVFHKRYMAGQRPSSHKTVFLISF